MPKARMLKTMQYTEVDSKRNYDWKKSFRLAKNWLQIGKFDAKNHFSARKLFRIEFVCDVENVKLQPKSR